MGAALSYWVLGVTQYIGMDGSKVVLWMFDMTLLITEFDIGSILLEQLI